MRRLSYEQRDLGYSFALVTAVMVVAALVLDLIFGESFGGWKFWLMQGLYTAIIGGSAFAYAGIAKVNVFTATKLNKAPPVSHVLWGCASVVFLVLCMSQINNLFLDLIKDMGLSRPSVSLDNNLVGLIICACILPAFSEEIVFRGTVAQSLYNGKSKILALAASGALFALFHGNPAQTLHQFVLGAFLTLLVFRSGSLWTSIIVHFFNNALVVALSYTPLDSAEFWDLKNNAEWAVPLMVAGIVGFAFCVFDYLKTTKSTWHPAVEDKSQDEQLSQDNKTPLVLRSKKASIAMLLVAVAVCAVLWVSQLLAG